LGDAHSLRRAAHSTTARNREKIVVNAENFTQNQPIRYASAWTWGSHGGASLDGRSTDAAAHRIVSVSFSPEAGKTARGRGVRFHPLVPPVALAVLALVPALIGARFAFDTWGSAPSAQPRALPGIGAFVATGDAVIGLQRIDVIDARSGSVVAGPRRNTAVVEALVSVANAHGRPLRVAPNQFSLVSGAEGPTHAAGLARLALAPYNRTELRLRFAVVRPEGPLRLVYTPRAGKTVVFDARLKGGATHVSHSH